MIKRFIQVVDDFYPRPDKVRQKALEMSYEEPEDYVGWRTKAYQPAGIKELIERKFRLRIKYWEDDLEAIEACNGVFFSAFSKGTRAETVGIHFDTPASWVMLLIYLTPGAPCEAGTSLWQHRRTGLIARPAKRDAERLGISVEKLHEIIERDGRTRSRWTETDRVGNVYNRAVIFPSGLLHSASGHFGSNRFNGRLYQSFHFSLDSA
ncbi:MAG TPA: DUF6445 family protein [Pyrinomonadaceae bacterium]|nr:DUF6445 family protein [Pyrinomonadaceae bacterium]